LRTLGIKGRDTEPISGRLRAAAGICPSCLLKLDVPPGAVFQHELKSAGSADSGMPVRKAESVPWREFAELLVSNAALIPGTVPLLFRRSPHGFKVTKRAVVTGLTKLSKLKANDAGRVFHAWRVGEISSTCSPLRWCASSEAAFEVHVDVHIALILSGRKLEVIGCQITPPQRSRPRVPLVQRPLLRISPPHKRTYPSVAKSEPTVETKPKTVEHPDFGFLLAAAVREAHVRNADSATQNRQSAMAQPIFRLVQPWFGLATEGYVRLCGGLMRRVPLHCVLVLLSVAAGFFGSRLPSSFCPMKIQG